MKNMLKFIQLIWRSVPQKIVFEFGLCVYQAAADFLVNVYLYRALVSLVATRGSYMEYAAIALGILAVCLVRGVFQVGYTSYCKPVLAMKLDEDLSDVIHRKQSAVRLSAYENPAFYDLMKRACDNGRTLPDKVLSSICNFISFLVTSLLTIFFVTAVDGFYLFFLAFPVIHSLCERRVNALAYQMDCALVPAERKRAYVMDTFFSKEAAKDIRTTELSSALRKLLDESDGEIRCTRKKLGLQLAVVSFVSNIFGSYMPLVCSCFYVAYKVFVTKQLSLADASVLIAAILLFCNRLSRIGNFVNAAKAASPYIDDWFQFMEFPEEERDSGVRCGPFETLEFRDASFSYRAGAPVLSGINVSIKRGERLCIVGMNGAGKTSFAKLLLGLYPLDSGELLYNGKLLTADQLGSYRNQFAVVFQDFQIYAASVAENVLMDIPACGDEARVRSALECVGLAEEVERFPNGIRTVLSKEFDREGRILSGGQNQKVAIARLYARDYEIAVLDEPSASLDPIAERDMYEQLLSATEGKTVVYISHNLSSALLADRILLFQDGKIAEAGTHQELMALKGAYARMFQLQADAYLEEGV